MTDAYGQGGFEAEQAARLGPLVERLLEWFRHGPPALAGATVVDARFPGGGASSDLVLLDLAAGRCPHRFAVRLEPRHAVYPDLDLGRHYRCLVAAGEHGPAPVPSPRWFEPDREPVGVPFIVSDRVEGEAGTFAFENRVEALPSSDQTRVWQDGVDLVAAVHATDIEVAGLDDRLGNGGTPVERYLEHWRRFRAFVDDGRDYPVLDAALDHLQRTAPTTTSAETLVWGDARFGNILYCDLRPVAALDFEFAHVGLPGFDVAFFVHFDRISFEYFRPGRRLPGFGGVDETFDLYEALSGRSIGDRSWYVLLAATYSALAVTRVMQPRAAAALVPESMVIAHPSMRALADLLGVGIAAS